MDYDYYRYTRPAEVRWAKEIREVVDLPDETWREVPDTPGYFVSNLGRVKSKHRLLKTPPTGRYGYLCFAPSIEGKQKPMLVHRAVALAFLGEPPAGHECRHLNGDRTDNRLVNLAWGTRTENQRDRKNYNTCNSGQRNGQAKLTDEDIRAVFEMAKTHSQATVANHFGISKSHVSNIAAGRRGVNITAAISR